LAAVNVGRVAELWRYPVKSVRGEQIDCADVQADYGVPGDRGWAVREESVGEIRSAKKIPTLLQFAARYVDEPSGAATPTVEITLPDGTRVRSDEPDVHARLSAALERDVTLWPRVAPEDTAHYQRHESIDLDEMRRQYGLEPDEPLPVSTSPPERNAHLRQYVSPFGTYFDAYELHLLSTTSINGLRARFPDAGVDVRRYRPNMLIDTGDASDDHPEFAWVGRRVRIGGLVIEVVRPMQRCSMIVHAQADLPRDRTVLRALVRETGHTLGVAAEVIEPGPVAVGDIVELL
jgi:uncharacterized protein YcbX